MKYIFSIILILFTGFYLYGQTYQSKWLEEPITPDGSDSEWTKKPEMFNTDTKMFYATRNDAEYLYLIYEIAEKETQQKFMSAGLEIEINAKGKPKLKATINLPIMTRMHNSKPEDMEKMQKGERPNMNQEYLLVANNAEINGFRITNGNISRYSEENDAFCFGIGWNDKQNMIVEIRIPLNELYGENYNINEICESKIKVKNTLKGLELPSMGSGDQQGPPMGGGGDMSGGGSMPQGGSMGGGIRPEGGQGEGMPPGGSMSDMSSLSQEKSFKFSFTLVNK